MPGSRPARSAQGAPPAPGPQIPEQDSQTPTLDQYGQDLTAAARAGKLDPVIGRGDEIEQTIEVLSRRTKNNPVLIGEAGVGKTAVVEGIAQRVADGEVPDTLRGRRVVQLDLSGVVAGTRYRGDFEERMRALIEEIRAHSDDVIVFIDELHTMVGAGGGGGGSEGGGSMDAGNMLKPALARGELHVIGATTLDEYRKHIESDAALARRFQPVLVPEPSVEDTVAILRGLADRYEAHHQVRYTPEALRAAVELSDRYVTDRFLPDKAIDLLDQAGARVRLRTRTPTVDRREIEQRVEQLERDKDQAVAHEDYERASQLRDEISSARAELSDTGRWRREPEGARGRRERDRRRRVPVHGHPGRPSSPRPSGTACCASRTSCTSASSGRTRRSRPSRRRSAGRAPGSATRTGRSAASCSSARPVSARPSWPGRWPCRCSATRTGWSGST